MLRILIAVLLILAVPSWAGCPDGQRFNSETERCEPTAVTTTPRRLELPQDSQTPEPEARREQPGRQAQAREEQVRQEQQQQAQIREQQERIRQEQEAQIRREEQRVYDQYRNERNLLLSQGGSYGHGRGYVGGEIEYTNIGVSQSVGPIGVQVNVDADDDDDESLLDPSERDLLSRFDAMTAFTRDRSIAPSIRQQVIVALRSIENGVPVSDALYAAEKAAGQNKALQAAAIPESKKEIQVVNAKPATANTAGADIYNMPTIIGGSLPKEQQPVNLSVSNNIKIAAGSKTPRGAISKLQVKANAQSSLSGLSLPASVDILLPKLSKKGNGFEKGLQRSLASIGHIERTPAELNEKGLATSREMSAVGEPELAGAGIYGPREIPSLARNILLVIFGAVMSLLLFWVFQRSEKDERPHRSHARPRKPSQEARIYKPRFRG